MNREREFDNILDECLEKILTKGETIEQCLGRYPDHAAELKPLLQTIILTKQATAITARRQFRESARHQFQAALREMENKPVRHALFGWQPRWATSIAAALVIFVLGGGGTVAAASNSMPDEPLYTVKVASEEVRLALTPTAMGKADLYVKLTDKRVTEISNMADKGKAEDVDRVAERLDRHLAAMSILAAKKGNAPERMMLDTPTQKAATAGAPQAPPTGNATFMATGAPPEKVAPQFAPAPRAPKFAEVTKDNNENKGEDKELSKADKQAKLKEIMARRAVEHQEKLRAALERAPDSVKPALRRAIALSEAGYQHALKSMEE